MRLMSKIILIIFVVLVFISVPAVVMLLQNQNKVVQEQAHIRAQAIYQMIVVTRQWVADNRDMVMPVPAVYAAPGHGLCRGGGRQRHATSAKRPVRTSPAARRKLRLHRGDSGNPLFP